MSKGKLGIMTYLKQFEETEWFNNLKLYAKERYGYSVYALFLSNVTESLQFIRYFDEDNNISAIFEMYDFVDWLAEEKASRKAV